MKAKEYADNFLSELDKFGKEITEKEFNKIVNNLGNTILEDFFNVLKLRNIGIGSQEISFINVIREFNDKWRRLAVIINEKNSFNIKIFEMNGFLLLLENQYPDTKHLIAKI